MPDWSYRTVFRPVLFRLPPRIAREITLGAMGTLASLPGGPWLISFLGHMRPNEKLHRSLLGVNCLGPVGLAGDLDINLTALGALARLGFGFVEVGPVTADSMDGPIERRVADQALWCPEPPPNPGAAAMVNRLRGWGKLPVPLLVRVPDAASAAQLAPLADALVLTGSSWQQLAALRETWPSKPMLLAVVPDANDGKVDAEIDAAYRQGITGVVIDAVVRADGGRMSGLPALDAVVRTVRRLRQR